MRIMTVFGLGLWLALPVFSRPINFDDLYSIPRYDDVQISPDGEWIVFVLEVPDVAAGTRKRDLWLMRNDGRELRRLTSGPDDYWRPRWSPDGTKLYCLSNHGDEDQVWMLPLQGGEASRVTRVASEVSSYECSPTADEIIFVSRVFPDCHADSCHIRRQAEIDTDSVSARLYDKLLYRHNDRWDDGRVNRLFRHLTADGVHAELYSGPFDAPTALLTGYGDYAMSPDGREICFAMSVDSTPAVRVDNDLYIMPVAGGKADGITDNPGLDTSPRYSPDGRFIAYHAMARAGYESDQRDLIVYDRKAKRRTNLTPDFDRSVGKFAWHPNSRDIYFTAIDRGFSVVWRVDGDSKTIIRLLDDAVYGDLRVSPDGRYLVVSRSLSDRPYELYRYDIGDGSMMQLTYFTDSVTAGLGLTRAEEFWFAGTGGDSIHGFLTKPPGFDPAGRYPLVLLIHGGPQWYWLGDFNYYGWNTQLTAAQGYLVAQIDPHGSVGYGLKFKEYVSGNWGRNEFDDLMLGVDFLIDTCPYIDTTRMAALGRSYGGFMVNWICGHTDRFACLIGIDGSANQVSAYGSTEELWFPEWEFGGPLYDNWEEYERTSPIRYARNFKTPTMLVHGQKDYRVDVSETLQMFTALQRVGVPSQLLYFPDEGHSIRRIKNHRYVYEKQFEWLARWLKP